MKIISTAVLSVLLVLAACGTASTPMSVSKNYLDAMEKRNYEEARKYLVDESKREAEFYKDFVKASLTDYIVVREEINDNTAKVYYREVDESELKVLNLVKIDNSWKIVLDLE